MFNKFLPAVTLATSLGCCALATTLTAAASTQSASPQTLLAQAAPYQQTMAADNFSLWNSGEMSGIAFDIWRRPAAVGGGYYYFLWKGQYASVPDKGNPEVVVFFEGNIAQLKSAFLVDCYNASDSYSPGSCLNPESKPAHYRYQIPCIFPWQVDYSERSCGVNAAIPSPGIF